MEFTLAVSNLYICGGSQQLSCVYLFPATEATERKSAVCVTATALNIPPKVSSLVMLEQL